MIKAFGEAGHLHQVGRSACHIGLLKVTFQGRLFVRLREGMLWELMWVALAAKCRNITHHLQIGALMKMDAMSLSFFSCERWFSSTLNMFVAQGRYGRYDHWNPLKTLEGSWTLGPIAGELSGCSVVFLARVILVLIIQNCTINSRFFYMVIYIFLHVSVKVDNASCKRGAIHLLGSFSYW